jgi:inner membrane protein
MGKDMKQGSYITSKLLVIASLILSLLAPLMLVDDQIENRNEFQQKIANSEVAKGWGQDVWLRTPYLSNGMMSAYATTSETIIQIDTLEKKRGVFFVPVYVATYRSNVKFDAFEFGNTKATLTVPIVNLQSLQDIAVIDRATGKTVEGSFKNSAYIVETNATELEILFSIRGTGQLTYEVLAAKEEVVMQGNWKLPKFTEDILPTETKISSEGFEARWKMISKWPEGVEPTEGQKIGLSQLWSGTDYAKIKKTTKYGILFITLTFMLVLTLEFLSGVRIHPVQYVLIGLAICLFYLLLLALSEMIGFNFSYFIATFSVTGLIVFYSLGFLNQKKFVWMLITQQVMLSGFFYILVSLQEHAFLIGSLGLFIALTVLMSSTRHFDWYASHEAKYPSI